MSRGGEYRPKGEMMMKDVECIRYLFSPWQQEEPSFINNQPDGEPAKKMRNWSMMPRDVSNLIAEKIFFPPVLHKFASSCKEWRSDAEETLDTHHTREPLLMLPYDEKTKLLTLVRLKNFQIYNRKMPQLQDRWIFGASNGCLAVTDASRNFVLFNIFKGTQLPLPILDQNVLVSTRDLISRSGIRHKVLKVALSENPSCSNCHVAIITDKALNIALCKLGNDKWMMVDGPNKSVCPQFRDIIFFQGKICAVNTEQLVVIDYHDSGNFSSEKIPIPKVNLHEMDGSFQRNYLYLAVLFDELLLVERLTKQKSYNRPLRTHSFKVSRFEKNTKSWIMIYSLGDQSLFIGANKTVSISTKEFPWCKPNCIYFLDNCHYNCFAFRFGYECDNGLFCLDDGHIENLDIDHSTFSWKAPAIWCM